MFHVAAVSGAAMQVVQLVGAVFILSGYVANQVGALATDSLRYLALNLIGAAILATLAAIDGQVGFLLLEGVWAVVSASALLQGLRRSGAAD